MKCSICNETEVIKLCKPEKVEFQCKQGHCWAENYIDQGGPHPRPANYRIELEDILFPAEKVIYELLLKEIDSNKGYYHNASPAEKTKSLIEKCNIGERDMYNIIKKIEQFNKNCQS